MRHFNKFILFFLLVSCNQRDSKESKTEIIENNKDTILNKTKPQIDSLLQPGGVNLNNDSTLISLSLEILRNIKSKNYQQFAEFIHPESGIRFSPYAFINTKRDQVLSSEKFVELSRNKKQIVWGIMDANEETIKLNITKYFEEFVYDADFVNAEKRSINKIIGSGNSLNNIDSIYPGYDFTEFHFSGFDPKFEGMDWRSLRLVFKNYNNKPYLVAIIHDGWTI